VNGKFDPQKKRKQVGGTFDKKRQVGGNIVQELQFCHHPKINKFTKKQTVTRIIEYYVSPKQFGFLLNSTIL